MSETITSSPPPRPPVRSWYSYRWQLLTLPMLAFITLPLLALFLHTSPAALLGHLRQPTVLQAVRVSLNTTLVATAIIVVFGTPIALFLAQPRPRFRRVVDTLTDLPTVLPPAVAGVALLIVFGRRGYVGGLLADLGIQVAFTQAAVVMAQVFIASPFYIKSAALGFAAVEPETQQAAALDGASGWQIFRYVIVPLSWPALLSGSLMSWARALGEFGATIIFAGNFPGRTQTMPLAIYIGFQIDLEEALALSVILVGFSFLALLLVKGVFQREKAT
jgi:molybdate transport system permease protein